MSSSNVNQSKRAPKAQPPETKKPSPQSSPALKTSKNGSLSKPPKTAWGATSPTQSPQSASTPTSLISDEQSPLFQLHHLMQQVGNNTGFVGQHVPDEGSMFNEEDILATLSQQSGSTSVQVMHSSTTISATVVSHHQHPHHHHAPNTGKFNLVEASTYLSEMLRRNQEKMRSESGGHIQLLKIAEPRKQPASDIFFDALSAKLSEKVKK